MEAFVEQSVVLVLLAFLCGVGTAGLVVGLTSRERRARWRSLLAGRGPSRIAPTPSAAGRHDGALPAPLLAAAPAFELLDAPRTRREARSRR